MAHDIPYVATATVAELHDLEAKVAKELPTDGKDARFAAGATQLLLTDPAAKTVKRYDLTTLNQDKEGPLPFPGAVKDVAMASTGCSKVSRNSRAWPPCAVSARAEAVLPEA